MVDEISQDSICDYHKMNPDKNFLPIGIQDWVPDVCTHLVLAFSNREDGEDPDAS